MLLNGIEVRDDAFAGFEFFAHRIQPFFDHRQRIGIHQLFDIGMQGQVIFVHLHGGGFDFSFNRKQVFLDFGPQPVDMRIDCMVIAFMAIAPDTVK